MELKDNQAFKWLRLNGTLLDPVELYDSLYLSALSP